MVKAKEIGVKICICKTRSNIFGRHGGHHQDRKECSVIALAAATTLRARPGADPGFWLGAEIQVQGKQCYDHYDRISFNE